MKKIYSLLLAIFGVVSLANAQTVVYHEGFENGIPAEYILVDGDGGTPHVNLAAAGYIFTPTTPWIQLPGETNSYAMATSWYQPAGKADDWMIIPNITVDDANTFLKWSSASYASTYMDSYEVRVSTTGTEIADFTDVLESVAAEPGAFTDHGKSLAAYDGQTINIAFRLTSTNKILFIVDYIETVIVPSSDLEIVDYEVYPYAIAPADFSLQVTFRNNGASTVTSASINLNDGTSTDMNVTLNLPTFGVKTVTLPIKASITTTGKTPFTIKINDADENLANNETSGNLYGLAYKPNKMVLFEEGTGTWCGWCPRGTVGMDNLNSSYPETTALIAVHNDDPMTVDEYDAWLRTLISGFPSGVIDRDPTVVDPGNFVASYNSYFNKVSAGTMEVSTVYDENSRQVTVTGVAKFASDIEEDIRIAMVLTENNVTGSGADWNQVNYYAGGSRGPMGGYENKPDPVPAADMVYDHVARALLTDVRGDESSLPASIIQDQEYTYTKTYTIPANQKPEDMEAIVMILDAKSGRVLGTGKAKAIPTGIRQIGEAEFHLGVQQNPFTENLQVNILSESNETVVVTIFDATGREVFKTQENISRGDNALKYNNLGFKPGMYLLNVTMGNKGSRTQQIIAQ